MAQQGNRIVAVGGDDHGGMRQSVAVWVSSDGSSWARVPHDRQVFGRTREQTVYAVAPLDPGFIAVGRETPGVDRDAAIWTSPNGLTWQRLPQVEEVFGG